MSSLSDDDFISRFFSTPNTTWPGRDPDANAASALQPFLDALTNRGECPLVLPRREASWPAACYYVICWDTAHAGRIRSLIDAATAYHWTPFDGRVASLNPADPVDAAVLDLVGPGTTFILRPALPTAGRAYTALYRLVRALNDVPLRRPNLPRPIGRMLREFDLALASGAAETSARLLQEIETLGGISHENVAFLQVRRLARLGKDAELLAHGSLPTLVNAEPPRLVREGILGAWTRVHLPRPIREPDVGQAIKAVRTARPDVAMLVDERLVNSIDPDVTTFSGLVALARNDVELRVALARNDSIDAAVRSLLIVRDESPTVTVPEGEGVEGQEGVARPVEDAGAETPAEQVGAESWTDWAFAVQGGFAPLVDLDDVGSWPPVWSVDLELVEAIDALSELATDDLLSGVAGFLEADDLDRPAPRTAQAFLRRYLIAERFAPHDLGAICSLLDVFLRGAPNAANYREVLGDIGEYASQWVAIATASRALDLADIVALGPTVDAAARADFVATVLGPLNQQKRRLSDALRGLAGLVTEDVGLDFDWSVPVPTQDTQPETGRDFLPRILLYSLDEGTLSRVQKAIQRYWPGALVRTSSDKDGSPMLKQHARNSDLIVMATRRAAHAATGCISASAGTALIRYPDGAGSASMLRSVASGLAELYG